MGISGGSVRQIEYIVSCGCIKPVADLLSVSDPKIIGVALITLENILKVGKTKQQEQGLTENPCCALIEQADGLTKIERLQEGPNEDLYQKAVHILEIYFRLDDSDDIADDAVAALQWQVQSASQGGPGKFQFGADVPRGGFHFQPN